MWAKFKWNKYFLIMMTLGSVCSCEHSPQYALLQHLREDLLIKQPTYFVLVITSSDCRQCIVSIEKELNKRIRKNYPIYGIYANFTNTKLDYMEDFMKRTSGVVHWHRNNRIELINRLYKASGQISGPYLLLVQNTDLQFL